MKKLMTAGVAAASIAGASLVVAAVNPLALAGAQTTDAPAATAPGETPNPGRRLEERMAKLDERLKQAVASGKLTQEQADAMRGRVQAKAGELRERMQGVAKGAGMALDEVASFLGMPKEDLVAQLRSGQSLAAIAGNRTQGLIDHLSAKADARIDQAVADGKLPAERAAELKTKTKDRITAMVNATPGERMQGPKGPFGGRRGGAAAPSTTN
jgi:hypothetical protein